jgi:hypothetical protein
MEKKELLEHAMVETLGLFKDLFAFFLKKEPKSIDNNNIMALVKIRLDTINKLYKEVEEVFPW